ncbi:MAG TPA: PP2C family protein-serine/threonine phosphatase [Isosphaeraceae bacterium]|jgi:serine phosphatase RsbU (regulator of sigma subunit)
MDQHPEAGGGHRMQCMEIWGGSNAVDRDVSTPGLDGWVYSRPYEGAAGGGDVHYVSLCGGGIVTRLIVADVSGHGAAVAELAEALRALMRRNINSKSQTRLVAALNQQFAALAEMSRFATAVVATYLAHRRRLTVCNAGHPRPLWFHASSRQWNLLTPEAGARVNQSANLPLGLDDESSYGQFSVGLGPDDVVMAYTDALIEAQDRRGRMLGEEGLLAIARGLDEADPRALGAALLAGVDRYREGGPADDDVTLLTLRHNGVGPRRMTVGEKLDVYAKVFGLKTV